MNVFNPSITTDWELPSRFGIRAVVEEVERTELREGAGGESIIN